MNDSALSSITAYIRVSAIYGDDGIKSTHVSWEGGDIAGISGAFMDDADESYVQRDGDFITIGNLHVQLVRYDGRTDTYLVKRVIDA